MVERGRGQTPGGGAWGKHVVDRVGLCCEPEGKPKLGHSSPWSAGVGADGVPLAPKQGWWEFCLKLELVTPVQQWGCCCAGWQHGVGRVLTLWKDWLIIPGKL